MKTLSAPVESVRITSASAPQSESRRQRERRYMLSMGLRVLCFVGAVFVTDPWVRGVLLVGAVFLPYVAVVVANEGTRRSDGFELRPVDHAVGQLPAPAGN